MRCARPPRPSQQQRSCRRLTAVAFEKELKRCILLFGRRGLERDRVAVDRDAQGAGTPPREPAVEEGEEGQQARTGLADIDEKDSDLSETGGTSPLWSC